MAYLTKQEFAQKCGLTVSNLGNYIKRDKVKLSGEFVDDTLQINRDFLARRKELLKKKQAKKVKKSSANGNGLPNFVEPDAPEPDTTPPNIDDDDEDEDDLETADKDGLYEQKMRAEIKRIKSVEELNRLKIQKQQGELIPSDLVKPLLSQLSLSISSGFKNAAEILITEISHKKKLTLEETADLRKRLINVTNDAVREGVLEAKRGASLIIETTKTTRGVGERA